MAWGRAVGDLKLYDLAVDLVGSRATNLADDDADVNVLVSMPLKGLQRALEEQGSSAMFKIIPNRRFRIDALHLLHPASGAELIAISRWSADIFIRERDELIRLLIEYDERVPSFLTLIGNWYRRYAEEMPEEEGFPNRYTFRIIGLYFLMARVLGVVLPPLKDAGPFLNTTHASFKAAKKASAISVDDLFQEWIKVLMKSDINGLFAHLRLPYQECLPGLWRVVDPASCEDLIMYDMAQPEDCACVATLSSLARRELARLKNEA
eukprot:TRINITY_DN42674_c0_g1_i1.p1 TRINITY_DN42674_c0_g1~~TRINITY_DN42674_c0_g1_i1.p1  ORF type:complete len:265 (+),score=40.89 TRINITY_DN42674_c0_g1_i1:218-1012(+)